MLNNKSIISVEQNVEAKIVIENIGEEAACVNYEAIAVLKDGTRATITSGTEIIEAGETFEDRVVTRPQAIGGWATINPVIRSRCYVDVYEI